MKFSDMSAAEAWGNAREADKTYRETACARRMDGTIICRCLRWMDLSLPTGGGDWIEVDDDGE